MVVHLLVFGSEKVVPLVVSSKQSSSRHGPVQPSDGVSSVAGLSLSVATTAADVSVHRAKDGPDLQESGDLERQRKNLLVVMSSLLVDGLKQSSSRCGSEQIGIDAWYLCS
jgi:hypothetical protein